MTDHNVSGTVDNIVDALRHFSWNYHLTDTWYVTRSTAKILTDNHEFAEKGADYVQANYPNSSDSFKVLEGQAYARKLISDCKKTSGGSGTFWGLYGPSSLMDFNNNEAGRAYESKGYADNFKAFDAAVSNGVVTSTPSSWNYVYLKNTAYAIFSGVKQY